MNHDSSDHLVITPELVSHISNLARLSLSEKEKEDALIYLNKVLSSFSSLSQIPLPPELAGDSRSGMILKNSHHHIATVLREDIPEESTIDSMFLSQAPEREGRFVKVPAILGEE